MRRQLAALLLLASLAGCPAPPPPTPSPPRYSVHLTDVGSGLDDVVAAVSSLRACTPRVARGLIERKGARSVVVTVDLSREEADAGVAALQAAGAKALVVEVPQ